jgi:7-cyano-7-deazaguanine synthase
MNLTKGETIRRGVDLGVDYGLTRSCYDPSSGGGACGGCDACLLRLRGFEENGLADPAPYQRSQRRPDEHDRLRLD